MSTYICILNVVWYGVHFQGAICMQVSMYVSPCYIEMEENPFPVNGSKIEQTAFKYGYPFSVLHNYVFVVPVLLYIQR